MAIVWEWIKRIIKIGIVEFLSKIGLKPLLYLFAALAVAAIVIGLLVAIIIAVII